MGQSRHPIGRLAALVAAMALVAAACSGGDSGSSAGTSAAPASGGAASPAGSGSPSGSAAGLENIGGEVSVLATWTDVEEENFRAMIQPWLDATGVKLNYTGNRDLGTQITTGIASGNLPDVAGLPGPGQMQVWYDQGALKPLDFIDYATYESSTPAGFAALG
ncbi:MAG TPA: hypothetical protein VKB30_10725, partial [Candidatus Limnocylindrales bacterium]|nr:hypothetical protein [Candidatus Limnocylindrales bacterium]